MTIGSSKQRSLFNQYRIRIANEYVRIKRENEIESLRQQISFVENEIEHLIKQIPSIDFLQIEKQILIEQKKCKQINLKYKRIRKQLLDRKPKLIIGHAYLHTNFNEIEDAKPLISLPEYEFLPPLPPPPIEQEDVIIPFQTPPPPPIPCSSDPLQLTVNDTIVKPRRLANRTLANISQMSFHIDPEQCSSPKSDEKKKMKTKTKKAKLNNLPLPPPPLFSSTAIFDTHAFFTQTNTKTKKQKKKIDISRQPIVSMNSTKKKSRTKKTSPYEFFDDDHHQSTTSSRTKLLTDDLITARFAKNSHYQTHQSSMASTKCEITTTTTKKKKTKKNILGIGVSSPLTITNNLSLSPGKLDLDNEQSTKSKRTRVK